MALDDFTVESGADALLPYVKFVKVDVLDTPAGTRNALPARLRRPDLRFVAEKVETAESVAHARTAGYTLFQGYFFCKPATLGTKALPARRLAYLHLFSALNRPDLTIADLEGLVKHDVSLSYRVLRCINSAAFGLQGKINSIRHALVLLGIDRVRKWCSVWSLAGVNDGGTSETVVLALLRARSCEVLGEMLAGRETGEEFFLLGLTSLLDAMLGCPMRTALADLPLPERIAQALLGEANLARTVLDAVIAYERGGWDEAIQKADGVGLPPGALPTAYSDALKWAKDLSQPAKVA